VYCALDEMEPEMGEKALTRSASAVLNLGAKLNGAIVAIGNAPTALFALIDMIDKEKIRPALVVGTPVGFVQARESKAELMKRKVQFITLEGTRGGSPLAAAAVNAILRLSSQTRDPNSK
jgi:precorrin-8X/cobalt-precorrin-8 methylmutase